MPTNQDVFGKPTTATLEELEYNFDIFSGTQPYVNPLGFPGSLNRVSNFVPISGVLVPRQARGALVSFDNDKPINGLANFYDASGNRQFVVMASNKCWKYNLAPDTFTALGGAITDSPNNLYTWAVVNNQLLFSQNVDKIWTWDGAAANVSNVSANAPITKSLLELVGYLLAGNIDDGARKTQTIKWCASGDPTNWTTLDSGSVNLFNAFGPIEAMSKIQQQGFAFQSDGISSITPTGSGLKPFDFRPVGGRGKGCFFPFSVSSFGDTGIVYVARDNVYLFTGSETVPIGYRPLEGSKVRGAWVLISQLLSAIGWNPDLVFGTVISDISGVPFRSYWLCILPAETVFVYSLDADAWFSFRFDSATGTSLKPRVVGRWPKRYVSGNNLDFVGIGTEIAAAGQPGQIFSQSATDYFENKATTTIDDQLVISTNFDYIGRPDRNKNALGLRLCFKQFGSWQLDPAASYIQNDQGTRVALEYTFVNNAALLGDLIPREAIIRFKLPGQAFLISLFFTGPSSPKITGLSLIYSLGGPIKGDV